VRGGEDERADRGREGASGVLGEALQGLQRGGPPGLWRSKRRTRLADMKKRTHELDGVRIRLVLDKKRCEDPDRLRPTSGLGKGWILCAYRVLGRHARVPARRRHLHHDVQIALLRDARVRDRRAGGVDDAVALVEDERKAVLPVRVQQRPGQRPRALEPAGFLVEPERGDDGAGGSESVLEKGFDGDSVWAEASAACTGGELSNETHKMPTSPFLSSALPRPQMRWPTPAKRELDNANVQKPAVKDTAYRQNTPNTADGSTRPPSSGRRGRRLCARVSMHFSVMQSAE
jgi:hypothetical protein